MVNCISYIRKQLHTLWCRRLLIGLIVAITSQLYLSVWAEGFRVSAAVVIYPILLMSMMRSSHQPDTGFVTCLFVICTRVLLDVVAGVPFPESLRMEYPGGIFYLCYDCLLCLLVPDRRTVYYPHLALSLFLCDFFSNILNLVLSNWSQQGIDPSTTLLPLLLIALFRSSVAMVFLWGSDFYHRLLQGQEHENRYQRLFIMTAELKTELYFLKKDAEDIERIMSRAYRLYERLGELNVPEEERAMALSIARDVHEVKKDNLRIIRGIEGEVADVYDNEAMRLSDLFRILEDSTRRMLGEQRANIRLECRCMDDIRTGEHYRLLSILKNLVTNAVEAIQSSSGSGYILVDAYLHYGYLVLHVQDDGPGIRPRAMNNLFKVGFSTKFDPATGNINRGVGLPAVRFIVDELDGTLNVESQPGKGAKFTVTLPLRTIQGDGGKV